MTCAAIRKSAIKWIIEWESNGTFEDLKGDKGLIRWRSKFGNMGRHLTSSFDWASKPVAVMGFTASKRKGPWQRWKNGSWMSLLKVQQAAGSRNLSTDRITTKVELIIGSCFGSWLSEWGCQQLWRNPHPFPSVFAVSPKLVRVRHKNLWQICDEMDQRLIIKIKRLSSVRFFFRFMLSLQLFHVLSDHSIRFCHEHNRPVPQWFCPEGKFISDSRWHSSKEVETYLMSWVNPPVYRPPRWRIYKKGIIEL